MEESQPDILVLDRRIAPADLARLVEEFFGDMIKYVVDIRRGTAAVGGEPDLWGANYYPGQGREDCIEYTSLINIRPSQGNRGMEIVDPAIRSRVREITFSLIGEGEPLP